ncbi:CD151 antigen-like [Pollicipes pollicipes]|uniref:CD151 antigen-like n=1 Tax=Pollicipes pollicipes TaxID=41117 RepID=UPI001884F325|nr:CD151 antigen-like [Pollicipes pollicipes]
MPLESMIPMEESKDEGCCSINFLKYVLYMFNFVFMLSGLAVFGVAVWSLAAEPHYILLLATASFGTAAYVLMAAGLLVVITSVVGCLGALRESLPCLLTYTFVLLLIFLMESMAGVLAYVYQVQLQMELAQHLNSTFTNKYGMQLAYTEAIDDMQQDFHCCGATYYTNWQYSRWLDSEANAERRKVPDSCCKTVVELCGRRDHPSNINPAGCVHQLDFVIQDHLVVVGAVGVGVSVVQIFGVIISCCLFVKLKNYGRGY